MKQRELKDELRKQAEKTKELYRKGEISELQAREMIQPYLNILNFSIGELERGYGIYIKKQTFENFMKYKY